MRNIPPFWKLVYSIFFGLIVGIGTYNFIASNAISYLSDSPSTCVNCHVMNTHYSSWAHSSHRRVTTCNDCHVPQDNFIYKWLFKAEDGIRHVTIFTLRAEPQVIEIKHSGKLAVQQNCIRCHEKLIENVSLMTHQNPEKDQFENRFCWHCHREQPHKRVNSLASSPNAFIEKP